MSTVVPMLEITDMVLEFGGESLLKCVQCGTCSGVCPWGMTAEFSPRLLMRQVGLGMEGYEEEALWRCVTCATCNKRCPREIDLIDAIRATRTVMLASGFVPPTFRAPLTSLHDEGNPWGAPREERATWMGDLELPEYASETEELLFACCTSAYDPRNQKALRRLAALLLRGGVDLGVLGAQESCCGDQAQACGDLEAFEALEEANLALFQEHGVRAAIVTSPHCMSALAERYGQGPSVRHYVQVLDALLQEGALRAGEPVPLKVAYHDPCYLGRHMGVYDAPRRVLAAIPELELLEFERCRERGICCGGGGGGIFSEVDPEERLGVLRVRQALQVGAQAIATACPFCTVMLEDARRALGIEEDELQVLDVAELLGRAVLG